MGINHAALMDRAGERTRWRGAGDADIPWSTAWVALHTGASYRQLDWWIRQGLVREDLMALGSGARRRFEPADLEIITTLTALAGLGCTGSSMMRAADSIRAKRVAPAGEWLLLTRGGDCRRFASTRAIVLDGPAWLVPVRPASSIVPAGTPAEVSA